MNVYWWQEMRRFAGVLLAAVLLGLLTGAWCSSLVVVLLVFVTWQLYQLYLLDRWINQDLKKSAVPDLGGVWGNITRTLYQSRQFKKKGKKKLARMVKEFRDSTAALPDATVILDSNLAIEWFNESATRLFGLQSPRDIGQRIDNLIREPHFREYLRDAQRPAGLRLASPQDRDVRLQVKAIDYGRNKLLLTARDVSSEEHLENVRRDFVSNASHELRTPLTVIRGYLELMATNSDYPADLQHQLQTLLEQSDRMESIIDDLLVLSRLENTHLHESEGEIVDVLSLLTQLADDAEQSGLATSGQINVSGDDQMCLRGMTSEITSVCSNLLHNALQHNPQGTRLDLQWLGNGAGEPCIIVADEGRGIEAQHLGRLTERFYRVDSSRSRDSGGTGLGLAIVKHIVQRHDGRLQISSNPGSGSQFTCCFPPSRRVSC